MKFYGILHLPTNSLFPFFREGGTNYNFYSPPERTMHKDPRPPRLFESPRLAKRYITEYCKGIRSNSYFEKGERVEYIEPLGLPRLVEHFQVVELHITMSKV